MTLHCCLHCADEASCLSCPAVLCYANCCAVLQNMRNIIARCLQKEASMRPTATELLQDKFFKVTCSKLHGRMFVMWVA
jgi:hypothetical protein